MSAKSGSLALKLAVAAAVLAAGAAIFLKEMRPVAVVAPVTGGEAIDAKPGSVTVSVDYQTELTVETGGRILAENFHLEQGDHVKEGQVLAQLDTAELKLGQKADQITADNLQSHITLDDSKDRALAFAKDDLENMKRQHELGLVSDLDLKKTEQTFADGETNLKLGKADAARDLALLKNKIAGEQLKIDRMTIRAPFDGVVSLVYAHPGDIVGDNHPIAEIITEKKIVVAQIAEEDFAEIKPGEKALVTFLPYGAWYYHGTVSKILPTSDPATQRHLVHLDVTDIEPGKLVPGITGEVSIVVGEHPARTIVPRGALFSLNGDCVYVVKDGRVAIRKVTKGYVWQEGVEIKEGLDPGDEVIVDQLENFSDGDRVRVKEVPSEIGAGSGPGDKTVAQR